MPFFSIIIPIYNASDTLPRCLKSISAQSFSDYEALLIDDGSTDASAEICLRASEEDARFRTLRQSNAGPSAARNAGLDLAQGRWICFVDSDDAVAPDYLVSLYERIERERCDCVFMGYRRISADGTVTEVIPEAAGTEPAALALSLAARDLFGYTWVKCFEKDLIGERRFDTALELFEDEVFTCAVIKESRKIALAARPLYEYHAEREGSLTVKTRDDYPTLCDRVYRAWSELLADDPARDERLRRKAVSFAERCRYYCMERPVRLDAYAAALRETAFFKDAGRSDRFGRCVARGDGMGLLAERARYRLKTAIHERWKR